MMMMSTASPRANGTHQKIPEHIWINQVGSDQASAPYHVATVALTR